MSGKFKLEIETENVAMRKPRDVAAALRKIADRLSDLREGAIFDCNGNKVGYWGFEEEGK